LLVDLHSYAFEAFAQVLDNGVWMLPTPMPFSFPEPKPLIVIAKVSRYQP
jgi:hypothetical protein